MTFSNFPSRSKFLFKFFATLLFLVSLSIIVLLSFPKVRHGTFLMAQKIPGGITYFFLNQYVPGRHFEKAIPWLDRQLSLTKQFSQNQNTLLPDLIKNTEYVFERARFPEEMLTFSPFLTRLVESFPRVFIARVWLGKAIAFTEPILALEHLEEARKIVSVDDRPYRIALAIALRENLPGVFQDWCGRFQKAQLGGHHYEKYNTLFSGLGLKAIALEVNDNNGVRELVGNTGLQLGEQNGYDFPLKKNMKIYSMRLHLGLVPGVLVHITKFQFYKGGKLISTIGEEVSLMSWSGYHLGNGDILFSSQDSEVIDIYLPKKKMIEADRIQVNLRFKRPGLGSPLPCGSSSSK
jgi:hypothetical protein